MSRSKVEEHLRSNNVPFQVHHHPAAYTAQRMAQTEHIPGKLVVKVVVVFADDAMALLALPATLKVNLTKAAEALGVGEVRLASEEEFSSKFPDCEVGAMPPFGNLYDLPVYVDKALTEDDVIHFPAASHSDTLSMAYVDFARLVEPTIVDIGARARATS